MLVIARLKLTSPMLGDTRGRDGRRMFRKTGQLVQINEQAWRSQFREAARDIPMAVNVDAICPPPTLIPASCHNYIRNYSQVKTEEFESFRKGTILTIQFMIKDSEKAPTLQQFSDLLSFVGTWLGLSPWGSKFGYGRFELLDLDTTDQATHELRNKNQTNEHNEDKS